MRVIILANVEQQEEIASKNTASGADLVFLKSTGEAHTYGAAEALFFLLPEPPDPASIPSGIKAVFVNSVTETLQEKQWPANFSRINGWPGFLKRKTWEVVSNDTAGSHKILDSLQWSSVFVKDEPGFVAGRVISMIINEAFFALEEGISTAVEMDLAMKLGTRYPLGPFEWLDLIGIQNIYRLLTCLSVKDKRYSVAPLLEKRYLETLSS
jgi:3-hydroxybutyryl-CoA dehydrogenase